MITPAVRQGCWKDRNETKSQTSKQQRIFRRVGRALRRAAKTARMQGTPVYVWKNRNVVAEKPEKP
jgi:hypothetical protein